MINELNLLRSFYKAWERAESTRGCYSCCEAHDCRCGIQHKVDPHCNCGRQELNELSAQIDALAQLEGRTG